MPQDFYAKGTIKVKNAGGILEPVLPATDASCVSTSDGSSLTSMLSNLETQISEAENSGGIEFIIGDEPTEESLASFSNETMFAYIPSSDFSITIDTEATQAGEKTGAVPFYLYSQNATLQIFWGDGTTSTVTQSDYSSKSSSQASIHTYADPGIYTIIVKCIEGSWKDVYMLVSTKETFTSLDPIDQTIYCFRRTLISVNDILPIFKGTFYPNNYKTNFIYYDNIMYHLFYNCTKLQSIASDIFADNTDKIEFQYCFRNCTSLQSIPAGLFDHNTAATDFQYCFNGCTSLQSIPSELFDNNTAATSFNNCFSGCSSLQTIPSGLFDSNTAATNFGYCFYNCTSLQSIPSGLFDNNTAAANFGYCFQNCTSLQSIPSGLFDNNTAAANFSNCFSYCSSLQSIPEGLFVSNTKLTIKFQYCFSNCTSLNDFTLHIGSSKVSDCSGFVTKKTGTTRTIYVPSGSTTQTRFDAVASTLGLTIIGE